MGSLQQYRDSNSVSNSDIGSYYYGGIEWMVYKKKYENYETTKSLDLGSAIHCYVLRPEDFEAEYAVVDDSIIVSGMLGKFIEEYAKSQNIEAAYKASGFKIPITRAIVEFKKEHSQKYYDLLLTTEGKNILSKQDMEVVSKCASALSNNKLATELLLNPIGARSNSIEGYTEFPIMWKADTSNGEIRCKSLPDKFYVDLETRRVTLLDLKTTSKPVTQFKNSFELYEYYRQVAFYKDAIKYFIQEHYGLNPNEFWFDTYIVAIETTGLNRCRVFEITSDYLKRGKARYVEALNEIAWYYNNEVFVDRVSVEQGIFQLTPTETVASEVDDEGEKSIPYQGNILDTSNVGV